MKTIEILYNTFKGSGIGNLPYVTEIFTRVASLYYDRPIIIDNQKFRPSVACGFEGTLNLIKTGVEEKHVTDLFCSLINKDDIVMDVGASIGYYTILAAKRAKKVYAFEPLPFAYKRLVENVKLNNYNNVEAFQVAVANNTDKRLLSVPTIGISGSTFGTLNTDKHTISVNTITLDSLNIQPDLVKIDVEGAEVDVLKGMTNILKKGTTIICEVHKPLIESLGYTVEDISNIIKKSGYKSYLIQEGGLQKVDNLGWAHYLFRK